jgi:hypothetical protein
MNQKDFENLTSEQVTSLTQEELLLLEEKYSSRQEFFSLLKNMPPEHMLAYHYNRAAHQGTISLLKNCVLRDLIHKQLKTELLLEKTMHAILSPEFLGESLTAYMKLALNHFTRDHH